MADTRPTVLITGAGVGGIGGALCEQFHHRGYRVFCAARRASTVASLVDMGMEHIPLDVTMPAQVASAKEEISKRTGGWLDILVNNAGISGPCPTLDVEIETAVRPMFEVNVFGLMRMSQAFAPLLISAAQTKPTSGAPVIVNICSVAATYPLPFSSGYSASKAAATTFGDVLRLELAPFGVDVVNILTGGVRSNIVNNLQGGTSTKLVDESLYAPAAEGFKLRVNISQDVGMETEKYARDVVAQVIKARTQSWWWKKRWIWAGSSSMMARFMYWMFPRPLVEMGLMRKFALTHLKGIWEGAGAKKLV